MALTSDDRRRVADAIRATETRTDAEIVAITAPQSDHYADIASLCAVMGLFLLVAVQAAVPGHFIPLLDVVTGRSGWEGAAGWTMGELLTALLVLLAATFGALLLLLRSPALRLALVPASIKTRRVRSRAVLLFRTGIEARTATHSGALIYVSLAERRAEIVADAAVVARVPGDAWADAMAGLVAAMRDGRAGDGLVGAVEAVGAILTEHFPFTGGDPNELPDGMIEL